METLSVNLAGKVRYETLNGRRYAVAPMSLITPGVLNGSKGPLLYPADEITKNVDQWNHVPIVVYHPTLNGLPVSARDPDVLNSHGVGFVFRSKAENGSLKAEGWFDVEASQRIDNRVLESLEAGKSIELSTGLYTENEAAPEGATTNNGEAYSFIARNYKPDHLAILPDQVGACSIKDGCGVLVNKDCTCEGDDKSNCSCELANNELSHSELHDALSKQLKPRFTQDQENAWISEVFDSFIVYWQGDDLFKLSYSKSDSGVTLGNETPAKVVRETNFVTENQEPTMAKKELVDQVIANCSCFDDKDRETLNHFDDSKLEALLDAEKTAGENAIVANAAREAESKAKAQEPTVNTEGEAESKPQTAAEYLDAAPAEIRSAVQNAMRIEARERSGLIDKIVANMSDDAAKRLRARLDAKPLDELEDLALLANASPEPKSDGSIASYFGRAGGSVTTNEATKVEPLPLPTIDWANAN